jgi:hypothetical protein
MGVESYLTEDLGQRIVEAFGDKGWKTYRVVCRGPYPNMKSTVYGGPMTHLFVGDVYMLLPETDHPKDPEEVLALAAALGSPPKLPFHGGFIDLMGIETCLTDTIIYTGKGPHKYEYSHLLAAIPRMSTAFLD